MNIAITTPRLFIADDHPATRAGVRSVLSDRFPEWVWVGDAEDGVAALQRIQETSPDIVVIDVIMPRCSGLEVIRVCRSKATAPRFVVLTQCDDPKILTELVALGVNAILLKSSSLGELADAIELVRLGGVYIDPAMTHLLGSHPVTDADCRGPLTDRELAIVRLLVTGLSNREVGLALGCSELTVKTHKANLMSKLGLRNTAEVVAWAFINKVITVPTSSSSAVNSDSTTVARG